MTRTTRAGAELQLKFDALTTEDVAARLAVALSVLDGRRKLLAAKVER